MNCEESRQLIFEADLADLRMETGSHLSEHLRECAECRKTVEIILGTESTFSAALDALKPGRSFEEAVVTVLSETAEGGRRRIHLLPILLPLAAAAALFFIIFPLWNSEVGVPRDPVFPLLIAETPAVKAPAEKTAMILDSGDTDYQIIWLF